MTTPLPLTAVLVEHDDHWTGWIAELPEVELQAPTREAVTEALPSLALLALAHRDPDYRVDGEVLVARRRERRPARHWRRLLGRLTQPRPHFGPNVRTPRLDRCRTTRLAR